jgi:hypothetical protein
MWNRWCLVTIFSLKQREEQDAPADSYARGLTHLIPAEDRRRSVTPNTRQ